jgi:peroxiredoxin
VSESVSSVPYLDFSQIGPAVGSRFPDVVLKNQRGETIDLQLVRGKRKALVVFYRSASW